MAELRIRLDEETATALRERAKADERALSVFVRRLLERYVSSAAERLAIETGKGDDE